MEIGALIQKEFRRLKTDRKTLVLIFITPVILIIIFGLSSGGSTTIQYNVAVISLDYNHQDTVHINGTLVNDTAEYTPIFLDVIQNQTQSFTLIQDFNVSSTSEYEKTLNLTYQMIKNESIDAVIVLPENFTESVQYTQNISLILFIDGSDYDTRNGIHTAIQEPIFLMFLDIMKANITNHVAENYTMAIPTLEYDIPSWKNLILNYAVPMVIPLVIIGTTMNLTSLCIVSEGPLNRMLLTPMSRRDALLSKFLAYGIIAIAQSTEIFVMIQIFGLFSRGSLLELYLILIILGLVGVSIGLAISAIASSEQTANQLYIMMFVLCVVLSGNIIPVERMPIFQKILAQFFPLSHSIPILQGILQRGDLITIELVWLIGIMVFYLVVAYIGYLRKKIEV